MMKQVNLVLGAMTFGEQLFADDVTAIIKEYIDAGYDEIDTAFVYNEGKSEELIGRSLRDLGYPGIKVSTKVNPRISGKLDADAVHSQLGTSLQRLGLDSVDTYYLHFPDRNTPVDDALEACDDEYRKGRFKELGVSNFPAWLLEEVLEKCDRNGWVRPTVYEGLYNPLSRKAEGELSTLIRAEGIRFYAYNPLAGGILTGRYKSVDDEVLTGRFVNRPNYRNRYWKPSFFEAMNSIKEEAEKYDIKPVEAVYRWMAYHSILQGSSGDAIIIGASRIDHLRQNIEAISKGGLPETLAGVMDEAYRICEEDAPGYYRFYDGGKK